MSGKRLANGVRTRAAAGASASSRCWPRTSASSGDRLPLRPADAAPQAGGPGHVRSPCGTSCSTPWTRRGRSAAKCPRRRSPPRVATRCGRCICPPAKRCAPRRALPHIRASCRRSSASSLKWTTKSTRGSIPATSSKTTTRITAASIRSTSTAPSPSSTRASWSPGRAPSATSWTVAPSRPVRSASSIPTASPTACPVSMERVGEADRYYPWYEMRIRSRTRVPDWVMGDARGRLAGCITIRERVIRLIEKYGLDYFKDVCREYIEDSRRYAAARVRMQTVPGRIRKSNFKDLAMAGKRVILPHQNVDCLFNLPLEVRIDGDAKLHVSMRGASRWVPFGENIHPSAIPSAMLNGYSHMVGFDMFNWGPVATWEFEMPPAGSWANPFPVNYYASSGVSWAPVVMWLSSFYETFGRLYFSRGFIEEVAAGAATTMTAEFSGINQHGMFVAGLTLEQASNGSPARGMADGENAAWCIYTPNADFGNAEVTELYYPILFLGRNIEPDSGGYGNVSRRFGAHRRMDGQEHAGHRVPVRLRRHAQQGDRQPRHVRRLSHLARPRQLRQRHQHEGAHRGAAAAGARTRRAYGSRPSPRTSPRKSWKPTPSRPSSRRISCTSTTSSSTRSPAPRRSAIRSNAIRRRSRRTSTPGGRANGWPPTSTAWSRTATSRPTNGPIDDDGHGAQARRDPPGPQGARHSVPRVVEAGARTHPGQGEHGERRARHVARLDGAVPRVRPGGPHLLAAAGGLCFLDSFGKDKDYRGLRGLNGLRGKKRKRGRSYFLS